MITSEQSMNRTDSRYELYVESMCIQVIFDISIEIFLHIQMSAIKPPCSFTVYCLTIFCFCAFGQACFRQCDEDTYIASGR